MQKNGFSLIEVVITLTIISILTMVSIPVYQNHMHKVHRVEAKAVLLETAAKLEQYHYQQHSFSGASLAKLGIATFTKGDFYKLTFNTDNNDYKISAIPQKGDDCGTLSLNQKGQKSSSGSANNCW